MVEAVNTVKDNGARDVYMVFVHPVFSRDAANRMAELPVKQFITTDTIPIPYEKVSLFKDRLKILSIAPLLSEVILRTNEGRSVGEMFSE
jgi:ribose-phosphate pyrophosphokinase